jgi:hypothetical protein
VNVETKWKLLTSTLVMPKDENMVAKDLEKEMETRNRIERVRQNRVGKIIKLK